MKPYLIVNAKSGSGRTGRTFDRIAREVRAELGDFECAFTTGPGDATRLAREAIAAGGRVVVAVGGDGTASEVVDGIAGASARGVAFGVIPCGTGGDLRRTLGYATDAASAARIIAHGADRACDVGVVEFVGHDGAPRQRHFVNVCGCGIDARAVQEVERLRTVVGSRVGYLLGAAKALVGWRDQRVRWRIDGEAWRDEAITCLAVCNGRFFGGGMMIAPDARIDDGAFDVTRWRGLGFRDLLLKRHMLYDGTHVRLANTERFRARVVEVEPAGGETVLLDVDGDQPGKLPARLRILPGALTVRVPRE